MFTQLFTCLHLNWGRMKLKAVWISYRSFWLKWSLKLVWHFHVNKIYSKQIDWFDTVFNVHVHVKLIGGMVFISVIWQKWNFILGDKIWHKHYPKWNAYVYSSKYRVALKCSLNETSCEQNLISRRFEISYQFELISLLVWMYL